MKREFVLVAVLLTGVSGANLPNVNVATAQAASTNESAYRALERQAADYIRVNYRLTIRNTSSNASSVYVTAYRPKVGSDRTFRFSVQVVNRRLVLITPPTALN